METLFFYLFSVGAVASAVLLVLFRNPVHSALSLVATLFCLAGLFVLLNAHFLAAAQIIVYAGAIMVLFLFVIMLLNLGRPETLERIPGRYRRAAVLFVIAALVAELAHVAGQQLAVFPAQDGEVLTANISTIGRLLFTDYLIPFEVASMVLLVALIGVIVLVKRDRPAQSEGSRDAEGDPGVEEAESLPGGQAP